MEASTHNINVGMQVTNDSSNGNVCNLYFTDAIYNKVNYWTGQEESMLADIIKQVNDCKPNKIVNNIDSWGGSCDVGLGVYNYLKSGSHGAKVETMILNSCASIATVIAASGAKGKVTMPRNGFMVIHKAQTSASGTADDLRNAATVCDAYTENILDIYVQTNRKGKTRDDIYNLIKDGDYWMTGTQAKELGFVDDCYNNDAITITNSIAAAKKVYNNIPPHILNMAEPSTEGISLFDKIKNYLDMKVADIKAAFTDKLPTNGIVGQGDHALDIKALLTPAIDAMLDTIAQQITADIATATTTATEAVTNGVSTVEAKYKDVLDTLTQKVTDLVAKSDAQATVIAAQTTKLDEQAALIVAQKKNITDLTADVANIQGKPAPAAGNDDPARAGTTNARPTFKNRTTAVNVG